MRLTSRSGSGAGASRAWAVAACAAMLLLAAGGAALADDGGSDPSARAAGSGGPLLLGRTNRETDETVLFANNSGYALRESNLSSTGGGAIHGCRSGTQANANPCLQAVNLRQGQAFRFYAQRGSSVGSFILGTNINNTSANPPFRTNGTGMIDNLNADMVDGFDAACPSGAMQISGVCYDAAPRPAATLQNASNACAAANGKLASAMELSSRTQLNLAGAPGEWSSDVSFPHVNGAGPHAVTVSGPSGALGDAPANTSLPYRCAYELVQ